MKKPSTLVISGYGINCEEETQYAFQLAGACADIVHINDLIKNKKKLKYYQIIAFPGGFAYGDHTGSGKVFANKIKSYLWGELQDFMQRDTLMLGICNGFQIMANLGIFPTIKNNYGEKNIALITNDNARYTIRWVDVAQCNENPFLHNIKDLSLPIAHGEGKFYATKEVLREFDCNKRIALKYIKGDICTMFNLAENPNGSLENIAGITDSTGRIFGLMPHPERALFTRQLPLYTLLKDQYSRKNKKLPLEGPGLQIFKNAVQYFLI